MLRSLLRMSRIIANLIVIASVFLFPWWVPVLLSIAFVFLFDYVEVILIGALLDGSYGMYGFPTALFTSLGLTLFLISLYIKPKLSLYNSR